MPADHGAPAHPDGAGRQGRALVVASLRRRRIRLLQLGAWSVVEAVPAMLSGALLARAIDDGFLRGDPGRGVCWLAAMLAAHVTGAVATRFTFPIIGAIVEPLRDDLLRAVVDGLVRGADGPAVDGSGISRVTQQVESVRRATAVLLNGLRRFAFTLLAAVLGLGALAPEILWLVLPPVVAAIVLFALMVRSLAHRERAALDANERVARETSRALAGARDIRAFRLQDQVVAEVGGSFAAERSARQRLALATGLRSVVTAIGAHLPLLALLLGAGWLLGRGVTVGALLGAATYVSIHIEPAMRMLTETIGGSGLQLAVTVGRLASGDRGPGPGVGAGPEAPESGDVRVDGVTFAYGGGSRPVIRDLTFAVPDGGHLAVVGPSGIGKSTLAALVCGLDRPDRGRVLVGGVRPAGLAPGARRESMAFIPQEAYVFGGTLRDNVRYLRGAAADEELSVAARAVGADALFARLGGLDARLDPGLLSEGEKQLVALVRAYVSRARVTVLDEAACHLDPEAEARAEHAFRDRPGTLIVIAHRITSALRADRVLLLDGLDASFGDHETLLATSALYGELAGDAARYDLV